MLFKTQISGIAIKKVKSQIANMMTLCNLFLGGFSIIFTIQGQLRYSALLIFIAALLDRFDGMVARKLKIDSELGKQLDSMSDIISFGVAPALLLYQGIIHIFSIPGIFFTVFYIGCGAFRLARFNITENNGYFHGLPITAAGCILTLCYLGNALISTFFYLFLIIILSFFMISPLKIKKV